MNFHLSFMVRSINPWTMVTSVLVNRYEREFPTKYKVMSLTLETTIPLTLTQPLHLLHSFLLHNVCWSSWISFLFFSPLDFYLFFFLQFHSFSYLHYFLSFLFFHVSISFLINFVFLFFSHLFSFHSHFYLILTNLTWRQRCEGNLFPFMYKWKFVCDTVMDNIPIILSRLSK